MSFRVPSSQFVLVGLLTLAASLTMTPIIQADDLLINGSFDDPLDADAWESFNEFIEIAWDPEDSGGQVDSGSLRMSLDRPSGSGFASASRCVQVNPGARFRFSTQVKIPEGQSRAAQATAILFFRPTSNCHSGELRRDFVNTVESAGAWLSLSTDTLVTPDDARSVEVTLAISKVEDGGSVDVLFDNIVYDELTGNCEPSTTRLCLNDNRFGVEVEWLTRDGQLGTGTPLEMTPDSGLFWFFEPNNLEVLVKVLDACAINNSFWVYLAATTDVNYRLTVTDTRTSGIRQYINPQGVRAQAVADTDGFPCP